MRKPLTFIVVVAAALVSAGAVSASAGVNSKPTTGERIGVYYSHTQTFAADTPFYIEHGYVCELGDGPCMRSQISGHWTFELYLDGVLQPSTVDAGAVPDTGTVGKLYLTNYPSGLPAGTYVFNGVFVQDGVVTQSSTVTVTFT